MHTPRHNHHNLLWIITIALISLTALTSCNSQKKILYIQNATPDQIIQIANASDLTIQPGDEIRILVSTDDSQANAFLNLIAESNRLNRNTNAKGGIGSTNSNGGSQISIPYTVSANGYIDFPMLGQLKVSGLTRYQIADMVKNRIIHDGLLNAGTNLVVNVQFSNQMFTTLGELNSRGAFAIDRDRLTLLEAIAIAGDLTIYGRRDAVWVIRQDGDARQLYKVDLTNTDFMNSPAYYVQQNDIIYVEPNSTKTGQSTVNENTFKSVGFWTSMISICLTLSTFAITLSKK